MVMATDPGAVIQPLQGWWGMVSTNPRPVVYRNGSVPDRIALRAENTLSERQAFNLGR